MKKAINKGMPINKISLWMRLKRFFGIRCAPKKKRPNVVINSFVKNTETFSQHKRKERL